MRIISAPDVMRSTIEGDWKNEKKVGFVPTMGALHKGHLELIRRSISENQVTVVSIFINPMQFDREEDLVNYPKDLEVDLRKLKESNVDYVFTPAVKEIYPEKPQISFDFGKLSCVMEGQYRTGHFEGVGIVVTKLLHIINPDRAYFGLKDLQQFILIKRMCSELDFRTQIIGVETIREPNGLAMSSRNRRLSKDGYEIASCLYSGLVRMKAGIENGNSIDQVYKEANEFYASVDGLKIEYLQIVNTLNLEIIDEIGQLNELAVCVAGYVEGIRLIDNLYCGSNSNRMLIEVLKSKIHRVKITEAELHYVGSITIDEDLMDAADLIENEKVQIVNINNGERLETYVIKGARGSGQICLNGPAARKAQVGDIIIIISYCSIDRDKAKTHEPIVIFPDTKNHLTA